MGQAFASANSIQASLNAAENDYLVTVTATAVATTIAAAEAAAVVTTETAAIAATETAAAATTIAASEATATASAAWALHHQINAGAGWVWLPAGVAAWSA